MCSAPGNKDARGWGGECEYPVNPIARATSKSVMKRLDASGCTLIAMPLMRWAPLTKLVIKRYATLGLSRQGEGRLDNASLAVRQREPPPAKTQWTSAEGAHKTAKCACTRLNKNVWTRSL